MTLTISCGRVRDALRSSVCPHRLQLLNWHLHTTIVFSVSRDRERASHAVKPIRPFWNSSCTLSILLGRHVTSVFRNARDNENVREQIDVGDPNKYNITMWSTRKNRELNSNYGTFSRSFIDARVGAKAVMTLTISYGRVRDALRSSAYRLQRCWIVTRFLALYGHSHWTIVLSVSRDCIKAHHKPWNRFVRFEIPRGKTSNRRRRPVRM